MPPFPQVGENPPDGVTPCVVGTGGNIMSLEFWSPLHHRRSAR